MWTKKLRKNLVLIYANILWNMWELECVHVGWWWNESVPSYGLTRSPVHKRMHSVCDTLQSDARQAPPPSCCGIKRPRRQTLLEPPTAPPPPQRRLWWINWWLATAVAVALTPPEFGQLDLWIRLQVRVQVCTSTCSSSTVALSL